MDISASDLRLSCTAAFERKTVPRKKFKIERPHFPSNLELTSKAVKAIPIMTKCANIYPPLPETRSKREREISVGGPILLLH
jgi:hypothetical protein